MALLFVSKIVRLLYQDSLYIIVPRSIGCDSCAVPTQTAKEVVSVSDWLYLCFLTVMGKKKNKIKQIWKPDMKQSHFRGYIFWTDLLIWVTYSVLWYFQAKAVFFFFI